MEILEVILSASASFITLLLLIKLMGNRQMSQLSMFDYINGITIGSIAAEFATNPEDFLNPLVAMIVYALFAVGIAYFTCKSVVARRIITGKPVILYENGRIYEKNLAKQKMDINEFLTQCRNSGYFDLSNIHTAMLETNGKISFLPMALERPATPKDLKLADIPQDAPVANVITDGSIMEENLKNIGRNKTWLLNQIAEPVENIFLATCDSNFKVTVYTRSGAFNRDIFD